MPEVAYVPTLFYVEAGSHDAESSSKSEAGC